MELDMIYEMILQWLFEFFWYWNLFINVYKVSAKELIDLEKTKWTPRLHSLFGFLYFAIKAPEIFYGG